MSIQLYSVAEYNFDVENVTVWQTLFPSLDEALAAIRQEIAYATDEDFTAALAELADAVEKENVGEIAAGDFMNYVVTAHQPV